MEGGTTFLEIINYSSCTIRLRLISCMHRAALIMLKIFV
jgi:hypothetical protein